MPDYVVWILFFILGCVVFWLFQKGLGRNASGTIHVMHQPDKTVYTLDLSDYPESIEFKKKVIFRVEVSEEDSDRE